MVSFELFPPKTPEAEVKLFQDTMPGLLRLRPAFMTCTYCAGGSTRSQTLDIVSRIRREFEIEAVAHLTCVGSSREELADYLDKARAAGITNIVVAAGRRAARRRFVPAASGRFSVC